MTTLTLLALLSLLVARFAHMYLKLSPPFMHDGVRSSAWPFECAHALFLRVRYLHTINKQQKQQTKNNKNSKQKNSFSNSFCEMHKLRTYTYT